MGTQYRSVIFYHSDEQKQLAEKYKKKLDDSGLFRAPIVTEIVPVHRVLSRPRTITRTTTIRTQASRIAARSSAPSSKS